jgi:hypothetical protein
MSRRRRRRRGKPSHKYAVRHRHLTTHLGSLVGGHVHLAQGIIVKGLAELAQPLQLHFPVQRAPRAGFLGPVGLLAAGGGAGGGGDCVARRL